MDSCFFYIQVRWVILQLFSYHLSNTHWLADTEEDSITEADSTGTSIDLGADDTTDHDSSSESELWEHFDFPQLTADEDAQLTIALQGGTPQPTTPIEPTATPTHHEAIDNYSQMRFGAQGPQGQGSSDITSSQPSFSPPPYTMSQIENNNSQPMNHFRLINDNNNDRVVPTSSSDPQFYIVIDGVCHIIRWM